MEGRQGRVLGASRTLAEAVSESKRSKEIASLVSRVTKSANTNFPLSELEKALAFFANNNSKYTKVQEDEIYTLAEELLNNSIRSVMVFDDFTGYFGDMEVYTLSLAFQYNLSVEALTLSGISVSDEAISSLCESLVRSRVNYIDLSNTPLEDDAGRSLAALAHVSPFLRTVVVGETLISEDVLDEIDVACQFNQSNFEGNDNTVDESLFKEADLNRLKSRMQRIIRAQSANTHFCVAHLFSCCPNGDTCLYSHALTSAGQDPTSVELGQKISELFSTGGDWEQKLPPRAAEGASWRGLEDGEKSGPKLNLRRRKNLKLKETDDPIPPEATDRRLLPLAVPCVAMGLLLTAFVVFRKYRC